MPGGETKFGDDKKPEIPQSPKKEGYGKCPWCKESVHLGMTDKHKDECFHRPRSENDRKFGKGWKT